MLFTSISFTGLGISPVTYDFIPNTAQRVRTFSPSVAMRSEQRPRMQMHGRHPVSTYADALQIHHEGIIVGTDSDSLLDERDLMLDTILGDLTATPTSQMLGTLTVKKANWTETASAAATLESWEAALTFERLQSVEYLLSWLVFTPYLVGDSTDTVYTL